MRQLLTNLSNLNQPFKRWATIWTVLFLAVIGAGCSQDMTDLNEYIREIKSQKSDYVDPIPQIQPYKPFDYAVTDRRDPFVDYDVTGDDSDFVPETEGSGLRPDISRNREPLEEFPLDSLRMIGTLNMRDEVFALVKAPDQLIHRVKTGNHLGQNYGEIIAITDSEIELLEIVSDGFGGYMQRPATVGLSE